MKILISEKLSSHKYKTSEGYLICTDAILARTGKQQYRKDELFDDDDMTEIYVDRPYNEVFSQKTIASFENKPITVEHPNEEVNVGNYKDYAVGYVRDVHQGRTEDGQDVILGNLVITDQQTINEIEEGQHTNLSCGYDCEIINDDDGNYTQHNIRGNHVALCECPRAGITKIVDSKVNDMAVWQLKPETNLDKLGVAITNKNIESLKAMLDIVNKDIDDYNNNISKLSASDKLILKKKFVKLVNEMNELGIKTHELKIDSIKDEFKPFFFKEDEEYWEDESEYVGNNLKVEKFIDDYNSYDDFINSEFTAKVLGSYGSSRENQEMKKYFEQKWPQKAKLAHRLFDSIVEDAYWGTNNKVLSKMDAINELKTVRIGHEQRWDAGNANKGWYVQIQNVGSTETTVNMKTNTTISKEKSYALGRIWHNDKHMFTAEGPITIVREKMISYLKSTSISDALNILSILKKIQKED